MAAGLPAGQNLVEGTEANLMVGAAAANSSWRRAAVATGAAFATLAPFLAGIWFLYTYEPGQYVDYGIAILVFGIGAHEVMEGLKDRPTRGQRAHPLDGPLGLDPADPAQIKKFQSRHGLQQDGVLGPRTRGAILAELRRRGEEPRPNRLGVDVTDEESVAAFQRRAGLAPDGVIGPRTQGALAAESARRLPDPADRDSVRTFQRQHRLPETGLVDARTQGALRALADGRGEETRPGSDGASPAGREDGSGDGHASGWLADGTSFADRIDLTSKNAITRFQRERGLPQSGTIDTMTQGALRAEIEWHTRLLGLDPADPAGVRQFQGARGLQQTGLIDEPTQDAIRAERAMVQAGPPRRWTTLGIDPTDPESIERFQALHGLERTGEIDQKTQEQLRRTEEWTAGIDPADSGAVRRFQQLHGIEPTGTVDSETQGAMRLYRTELLQRHDAKPPEATPAWYPLDPTDPASISAFQRAHGLPESGTIAGPTQDALREDMAERAREAVERVQQREQGGGFIARYRDAWPAYFGVILEGGEAGLFTIGVAQGTHAYTVAAIAGGAGFVGPWFGLIWLRGWLESRPKWVFELTIGGILVTAATIFGLFRATGVFGA